MSQWNGSVTLNLPPISSSGIDDFLHLKKSFKFEIISNNVRMIFLFPALSFCMYFSIRNKSWHCYFYCWKFITFCSFNLRGKNGIMTTQLFQLRIATGCKLCCNPINKTLWKNHYFATDGDKSAEKVKWGIRFIKIQNHN